MASAQQRRHCEAFRRNRNVNPFTGRRIHPQKATARRLDRLCAQLLTGNGVRTRCQRFRRNRNVNPFTGRRIHPQKATARRLGLRPRPKVVDRRCEAVMRRAARRVAVVGARRRTSARPQTQGREIGCLPSTRGSFIASGAEGDVFFVPASTQRVVKVEVLKRRDLPTIAMATPLQLVQQSSPIRELITNVYIARLLRSRRIAPVMVGSADSLICRSCVPPRRRASKSVICSTLLMPRVDSDVYRAVVKRRLRDGHLTASEWHTMIFQVLFALATVEKYLALYHGDVALRNVFLVQGRFPRRRYRMTDGHVYDVPGGSLRFMLADWGYARSDRLYGEKVDLYRRLSDASTEVRAGVPPKALDPGLNPVFRKARRRSKDMLAFAQDLVEDDMPEPVRYIGVQIDRAGRNHFRYGDLLWALYGQFFGVRTRVRKSTIHYDLVPTLSIDIDGILHGEANRLLTQLRRVAAAP